MSVNQAHIVERVALLAHVRRVEAMQITRAMIGILQDVLVAGDKVTLHGFGVLRRVERSDDGPGRKYVTFRPAKELKGKLNDRQKILDKV